MQNFDFGTYENDRMDRFLKTIGPNVEMEPEPEPQQPERTAFTPMVEQAIKRASKMAEALGVKLLPSQPASLP